MIQRKPASGHPPQRWYGRRDDGLMVGCVNLMQALELLFQLIRKGFDGVITLTLS
jgi:hypothetical protein